jgi:putative protease
MSATSSAGATAIAEIQVKNRFSVGDRLEIVHPGGNRRDGAWSSMRNAAPAPPSTARRAAATSVYIPLPPGTR